MTTAAVSLQTGPFFGGLLDSPQPSSEPPPPHRLPDFNKDIQLIINGDLMTFSLHSTRRGRTLAPNGRTFVLTAECEQRRRRRRRGGGKTKKQNRRLAGEGLYLFFSHTWICFNAFIQMRPRYWPLTVTSQFTIKIRFLCLLPAWVQCSVGKTACMQIRARV